MTAARGRGRRSVEPMAKAKERERVEVRSASELRDWLRAHHERMDSVWLVTWKKSSGGRHVSRREVLEALLSYGWIDSLPRTLDQDRTMLLISRRRTGSSWSKVNRDIVESLISRDQMTTPGLDAVDRAKRDGSWRRLEEVDALLLPADLERALEERPPARAFFDRFPPSSRRGILEWIQSAKRAETRAGRIAQTAEKAARNVKANHPAGRDRGPEAEDVGEP